MTKPARRSKSPALRNSRKAENLFFVGYQGRAPRATGRVIESVKDLTPHLGPLGPERREACCGAPWRVARRRNQTGGPGRGEGEKAAGLLGRVGYLRVADNSVSFGELVRTRRILLSGCMGVWLGADRGRCRGPPPRPAETAFVPVGAGVDTVPGGSRGGEDLEPPKRSTTLRSEP